MLKNLCFVFFTLFILQTSDAFSAQKGYISIAKKDPRLEEVFKDLKLIRDSLPYFSNKENDKANANVNIEDDVTNAMYDLQKFFSNSGQDDPEFYYIFQNARDNLTETEVESILRQAGMFKEKTDPISGKTSLGIENVPGYADHDYGKNKKWRAHIALILAFQSEVIQYMRYLMNTLTNMGVRTFISDSDKEITLRPLSNALHEAIENVNSLKKHLLTVEDEK